VFVSVGVAARTKFGATLQQAFPAERVYDLALSPLPANPFCWTAISVATDPQDNLVLRRATLAPIPALLKASACPSMATAGTAPMSAMDEPDTEGLRWNGRFKAPLAQLRELAAERCEVRALLRFVRVPYWTTAPGNKVAIVGDLRFDRDERLDFADMAVPDGPSTCPPFVPPWIPPRSDLLR
jgi:inner membrane protein